MEIISEAEERFKGREGEICGFLFDVLKRINTLEREISERFEVLAKKRTRPHRMAAGEMELWEEYQTRLEDIVKPVCTEKLLKRGYGGEFCEPSKYDFIDGECRVEFIMKYEKRAVVIAHFHRGTDMKYKFTLVKCKDGKRRLDTVSRGYESEPKKWYSESIR